jgi:ABC-type multidrug transport system ATPase subunit
VKIFLKDTGKRYYREWIFRHVNLSFTTGDHAAILGPNGSGKSTLLQVAAGSIMPTEGIVEYEEPGMNAENFYSQLSFASPYLELIEEFTFREIIDFHFKFKNIIAGLTLNDVLEASELKSSGDKTFRYFSSGMKQRAKLVLAVMSDTKVVMLDEPCSNLDASGIKWYEKLIRMFSDRRLIIVASNHNEQEYFFCNQRIDITECKPAQ